MLDIHPQLAVHASGLFANVWTPLRLSQQGMVATELWWTEVTVCCTVHGTAGYKEGLSSSKY